MNLDAPVTMAVALVCAIAFAVGHHAFYQNLNGQPTRDMSYFSAQKTYEISDQQVNVSVGTFFAFLVKALLGVAVSNAFDQFAWKSIKARAIKIAAIDNLFRVLGNAFMMLNWRSWRYHPLTMTLALVLWLLPVASVISPATLNVRMTPFVNSTLMQVPRVDFTSPAFVDFMAPSITQTGYVVYQNAKSAVQRVVSATSAEGKIMAIDAPSANSSWVMNFHGPALSCNNVDQSTTKAIAENIELYVGSYMVNLPSSVSGIASGSRSLWYTAWAPGSGSNGSLPFILPNANMSLQLRTGTLGPQGKYAAIATDQPNLSDEPPLSLMVATFPNMTANGHATREEAIAAAASPEVLQCNLYNASYVANFTYINGQQKIDVIHLDYLNDVQYLQAIKGDLAISNSTLAETFSYQSIMDVFGGMMIGSISNYYLNSGGMFAISNTDTDNTTIMSTSLANTKELSAITRAMNADNDGNEYDRIWSSHAVSESANSSILLKDSIEELFQNITISLMSSSSLQPNYSASNFLETKVTTTSYRNVYSYSVKFLWIAYGIAIGVTLICVLLGILAFTINHGSYSTKFSTILRVTQFASISTELTAEHCSGKDPVPRHISKADISFMSDIPEVDEVEELVQKPQAHVQEAQPRFLRFWGGHG